MSYLDIENKIKAILSGVEVSRVSFEGPTLCVYVKKPSEAALDLVGEVAKNFKKRVVIRAEAGSRLPEKKAEQVIKDLIADVEHVVFEDSGDVYIYLAKPVREKEIRSLAREVFLKTGWRAVIESGVPRGGVKLPTHEIVGVRQIYHGAYEQRK